MIKYARMLKIKKKLLNYFSMWSTEDENLLSEYKFKQLSGNERRYVSLFDSKGKHNFQSFIKCSKLVLFGK